MNEQNEIDQFLRQEYDGKKVPTLLGKLEFRSSGGSGIVTGTTMSGTVSIVEVRYRAGLYEIRDYTDRVRSCNTIDETKSATIQIVNSVNQAELDRCAAQRPRRR
jgi:hypothetical protein